MKRRQFIKGFAALLAAPQVLANQTKAELIKCKRVDKYGRFGIEEFGEGSDKQAMYVMGSDGGMFKQAETQCLPDNTGAKFSGVVIKS